MRLKYTLASQPTLTTPESISSILSPFGTVDTGDILVSLKPAPPKKPKRGIALVPFKQIGDAFAVVCASGREERGLKDVEVSWAEGKEPELIGWLKKMGKLGSGRQEKKTDSGAHSPPSLKTPADSASDTPFSSFPSTFVSLFLRLTRNVAYCSYLLQPDFSEPTLTRPETSVPGLDYEALTLMRMRQAERERLEREIREQDAQDES